MYKNGLILHILFCVFSYSLGMSQTLAERKGTTKNIIRLCVLLNDIARLPSDMQSEIKEKIDSHYTDCPLILQFLARSAPIKTGYHSMLKDCGIDCIAASDTTLFTGSNDYFMSVHNAHNLSTREKTEKHQASCMCHLHDGRIALGHSAITILGKDKLDTIDTVLAGHPSTFITSLLQLSNGKLVSSGRDFKVKVWDIESKKCIKEWVVSNHISALYEMPNKQLVWGAEDGQVTILNMEDYTVDMGIRVKSPVVTIVQFAENCLAIGLRDGRIIVWDIEKNEKYPLRNEQNLLPVTHTLMKSGDFMFSLTQPLTAPPNSPNIGWPIMLSVWDTSTNR